MSTKLLLGCGILAPLLYVISDGLASLAWNCYSYLHQTVSETFAVDAPTRPFVVLRLLVYSVLMIGFGFGVRRVAGARRGLRVAGALFLALGAVDLAGPFTPMHLREVLASGGGTVTDVPHISLASVDVLLIVCILISGAGAFGRKFRIYSWFTVLTVLVFGAWAGLDGPGIQANLPTPWVGLRERISIFAFMAWVVVLAGSLFARFGSQDAHQAGEHPREGELWERLYWTKPSSPTPPLRRG